MRGIDADHMNEVLPEVVATIRKYANLDPAVDLIPVKPTAHYTMGGIPVTVDGEVYRWTDGRRATVEGLFAAGECSCVSVHGANRRLPVRHPHRPFDGRASGGCRSRTGCRRRNRPGPGG